MATVADIQAALDKTRDAVTAQTTVIDSVKTLIVADAAKIQALSDQIAALQAGSVTQEQIDALAQEAADTATALQSNTDALAAAVPANTPTP